MAVSSATTAKSSTFTSLHDFCTKASRCKDGSSPRGPVLTDSNGNIYGTTSGGGKHNAGTVFMMSPDGTFKVLHDFCSKQACADGDAPLSPLVLDVNGNLYGTTLQGGNGGSGGGVAFELSPSPDRTVWTLITLHTFGTVGGDGASPRDGLTYQGASTGALYDGTSPLYGSAIWGGANGYGAVFQLTYVAGHKTRDVKTIYSFCSLSNCTDGQQPNGALIGTPDGKLYGVTALGGAAGAGVLFEVASDTGAETVLHSFCQGDCADGDIAVGSLAVDPTGNIFGTTERDALGQERGTIYKLIPNGTRSKLSVLYTFCSLDSCGDGFYPYGVVRDTGGNLYVTTVGGGAHNRGDIFELSGKNGTVLYSFCADQLCQSGDRSVGLTIDGNGNLLGATSEYGKHGGGNVFRLTP